ncbi:MAG: biliverdin-producing heme oxygenase [Phycisphaerales bacterium]|nr:biliverdin-producing heme oxygenase [Phycisphaerales bacterium]
MTSSPITTRLKNDNWDLHQIAERGGTPESMIKGTMSRDQFAAYLGQAIHVHRALDSALKQAIPLMPDLGYLVTEQHFFERYFALDLEFYQTGMAETLTAGTQRFVDHIKSHADQPLHIFGLHYVRMGALNGNRFVARKLRQVFQIDHPTDGMMSHDPMGQSQRTDWMSFKQGIDALALSDTQRDELFVGVRAAYVLTINLDLEEYMSDQQLLDTHSKSLDREVFDKGHSVHVPAGS